MNPASELPGLEHIGDALAASALVAAIIAALFTLWQADIHRVLALVESDDPGNWEEIRVDVRAVLYWRAIPLCGVAAATLLILANRSWLIAAHALNCASHLTCDYDDVQALLLLTEALLLLLCIVLLQQILALGGRLKKLKG
jgi:hypothetical protein